MAAITKLNDAELAQWLTAFAAVMTARGADMGFSAMEITQITVTCTAWVALFNGNLAAQESARAARITKDSGRETTLAMLSKAVARLQAAPDMTDAIRAEFDITVRDQEPTSAPAPATRPVLQINTSQLQRHIISFADAGTPTKKAKPKGAHHFNLYCKKGGPAPASDGEWSYVLSDTATPSLVEYDQAESGTTVYYRGTWADANNHEGEWSEMVQAKVPG